MKNVVEAEQMTEVDRVALRVGMNPNTEGGGIESLSDDYGGS